jgi:ankyrin repeat protein
MELISEDSEELFWKYLIVIPENVTGASSLAGLVDIYELAKTGRTEDVLESLLSGENANTGLHGACMGGHKELALLMVQNGGDIAHGLLGACRGGHKEMALLMIHQAKSRGGIKKWAYGLVGACSGGHKELVLWMIPKVKQFKYWETFLNLGFVRASMYGHKEIVLLMISEIKSSEMVGNWNSALSEACKHGHKELLPLIIQAGATKCGWEKCMKRIEEHLI